MSKLTKKSLKQEGLPGTNLSISIVLSGLWFLWAHAGMCVYGCRRVITCLIWQPNYGGLLHHAALQNQTPWNWLPSHLDLICDSTFSPALPLSPALCWALLIFTPSENKCPKDARVWSNGVLNYHSNNSNGGRKMLIYLFSAEMSEILETSYRSTFDKKWGEMRGKKKERNL